MTPFKIPDGPHTSIEGIMDDLGRQFGQPASGLAQPGAVQPAPAIVMRGDPAADAEARLSFAYSIKDCAPEYRIRSHRRLMRFMIDPVKKFLLWGVRPYIQMLIERQNRYNEAVLDTHKTLIDMHRREIAALEEHRALLAGHRSRLEVQDLHNAALREAAGRADAFIRSQTEINTYLEKAKENLAATVALIEEARRRIDAELAGFIKGQQGINQYFEEAKSRIEAAHNEFSRHQIGINQYFEESKTAIEAGLAAFIKKQVGVNDYFESAKQGTETAAERLYYWTNGFWREQQRLNREQGRFNRRWDGRYDLSPFYGDLTFEQRMDFIDRFRGNYGHLKGLHNIYVPYFRNRPGQVIDVGCGRGEFLEMLLLEGIESWGCDVDPAMPEFGRRGGVVIQNTDALSALEALGSGSVGGIFASQVVEHLFPGELLSFIRLARGRLAPGGVMVVETLNPQSLGVLAKSYYKDLDHKQPIDPDYLGELLRMAGFVNVEVRRLREFDAPARLPDAPPAAELGVTDETHALLTGMIERLNGAIWGAQDYFVAGEIPAAP